MRLLLVQESPVARDVDANVRRIRALLNRNPDSDIAVFPELFVTGYQTDRPAELALGIDSTSVSAIRRACAESETAFVGGYLERGAGGRVHNSMLVVGAGGEIAGNYRKTHLFGVESSAFDAGGELACIDVASARLAPMICFDMEIAEVARTLAFQRPDVFIVIAANMAPFYEDHLVASRARALDNRIPLVYVNRTGSESGFDFTGGSRVVDPSGRVVADLGCGQRVRAVDVTLRRDPPAQVDYLRHLRPELYRSHNRPS
ncbi:hypothetical protein BST14_15565 [Mycobacterium arosiense ATCC BAA-1401 = DSM 45069]|uniref:CN hydrolase domain-containing protein n=1 Tax=Mycobacterium arosiense ATCC BAA-1401 = DSM 45069 TaxID=1265311 RepID=A0A1W9ZEU0_MYCAI|nr:hypothetical protein BST14_15565 [Mycobacterium arosiense ATCC BAA-1401 = DSM 45069]